MPQLHSIHHEARLSSEGWYLYRRLKRLVSSAGGALGPRDYKAIAINGGPDFGIVGLIALRVQLGALKATLLSAPGVYFDEFKPESRVVLDRLTAARRAEGRRVVIVSKHEIVSKIPFDLARAVRRSTRSGGDSGACPAAAVPSGGDIPIISLSETTLCAIAASAAVAKRVTDQAAGAR